MLEFFLAGDLRIWRFCAKVTVLDPEKVENRQIKRQINLLKLALSCTAH